MSRTDPKRNFSRLGAREMRIGQGIARGGSVLGSVVGSLCLSLSALVVAQPVGELIISDRVLQSTFNGTIVQFGCANLRANDYAAITAYERIATTESIPPQEYLATFRCGRGIRVDAQLLFDAGVYSDHEAFVPNTFLSLIDVQFSYQRLDLYFSVIDEVDESIDFIDALMRNRLISEIGSALIQVSPEGCSWNVNGVANPDLAPVVRDKSGLQSHEFRVELECENPADRACFPEYNFLGRYYPTRGYLLLDHVYRQILCT